LNPINTLNTGMPSVGMLNTGILMPRRPTGGRPKRDGGKRTFIVTGIARSGTSLVAGLLKDAGVFMGQSCTRWWRKTLPCWRLCTPAT
jgi:hypothetical protein